ncbi:39S ribosomal protein L28, mitochondrial-like, partial [Limulus polyphemus]|uniref:Large ribosomal subunit protein bL28m n=1 Tax=Limulus polyphemus TaxID=6850 RepID=A0ABM1RXJ0_LIMPO
MAASSARYALRWKSGSILNRLPGHYKRHRMDLEKPPSPVHYREEPAIAGHWKKDPETGEKKRVENVPIPLIFPKEADAGIWGGEGIIKGFQKRKPQSQKVPHYWIPVLKQAVVYSEILDKYMTVTVTERTLQLIDEHYGFDKYILETPVQDLKSQLALDLRRKMLLTLVRREMYEDDETKREQIYEKYKNFIIP